MSESYFQEATKGLFGHCLPAFRSALEEIV